MYSVENSPIIPSSDDPLPSSAGRSVIAELEHTIAQLQQTIQAQETALQQAAEQQRKHEHYIQLLEEYLRLAKLRQYAAKSEKIPGQGDLFDEAELEVALEAQGEQLPDDEPQKPKSKKRQRQFSSALPRVRVDHCLSEAEKQGAIKTFFSKVKEELDYIPARLQVIEHWQEKAVFENDTGDERIVAAQRPVHPLGKCVASVALLAYVLVSKYADGLPLYRLEKLFKRLGQTLDRSQMAHWIVRLDHCLKPLITLIRENQNGYDYLQADETRIQVLKEDGKTAQSDKWMWVTCGGPPDKPSILFEYDPSRAGRVIERLLDGFSGVLQADGYSGYGKLCADNGLTRIGCWDHVRRKFVEAHKIALPTQGSANDNLSMADIALQKIGQLYAIERQIKDQTPDQKWAVRQAQSLPLLTALKSWLEDKAPRLMKGSQTRKAMEYALNQWPYLIGYCQDGRLNISNIKVENAIRPFAVGRRAWLFADTSQGAQASATIYSLIETAKANGLEPYAYFRHILDHIGAADSVEAIEALLPWNVAALLNSPK